MIKEKLKIIGEELNYSIPRVKELMDSAYSTSDFFEIKKIAQAQEKKGAVYLDINVGSLPVEMMSSVVKVVQEEAKVPLCVDSDDVSKLEKALEVYSYNFGIPILNSATEARIDRILPLKSKKDFQLVLLVSERVERTVLAANTSGEDAYNTAKRLFTKALDSGFKPSQLYIDPGMAPIGADQEGLVNMSLDAIQKVNSDSDMKGVHTLIGLSNLTYGLPKELKLPLQNAFLTLAIERGLDTIIGSAGRKYQILEKSNPYLQAFQKVLDSKDKIETFISEIYPLRGT